MRVAAGIKLTPALFIVRLLLTRQFKATLAYAVAALRVPPDGAGPRSDQAAYLG